MIDFSKKMKQTIVKKSDNPIEIYSGLDRTSAAGPLRNSQETVLIKWYDEKKDNKDVIIKLHTGEGKTLIGLLVLLSKMNKESGPCAYVCPNIYLVEQVCKEATKFGIPICTIGENNDLPNEFLQGKRILVTHVQKMFNGRTIFGIGNRYEKIGAIVLDDAHACLDAIRDAYVIRIDRNKEKDLYDQIFSLFEEDLSKQGEGTLWDIKNNEDYESIMMIPYWSWIEKKSKVLEVLANNEEKNCITFVWPIIKNSLENCQAFINGREIQIMPLVAPIDVFKSFTEANHRILMSATTQDDNFFVKTLGISIDAIKNPIINKDMKWSGEKMILMPSLISQDFSRDAMIEFFANLTYKFGVVALTPTWKKQDDYRSFQCVLLDKDNIIQEINNLQQAYYGNGKIRVLVNRYDGIDLPDNACRILILDSLPFFANMNDKYEERARIGNNIIRKKIAQKIEQGLGRSVRSEKDYSCIIIIGSDLSSFMRSINTKGLFSRQTQKQIEIGLQMAEWIKEDQNKVTLNDITSLLNQCLRRDDGWKIYYEKEMNSIGEAEEDRESELGILELEYRADNLFLQKKYDDAIKVIQNILDTYNVNQSDKGWYLQLMARYKYSISIIESQKLQKSAFQNNNELLAPIDGIEYKKIKNINLNRISNILKIIHRFDSYEELMLEVNKICENFSFGVEADRFERAVERLGELLGYESQRPDKTIKKGPDNLWGLGNNTFMIIECKSEVSQGRKEIYKSEVGQMNNHCGWFESEYHDAEVYRIMIIPTVYVAYDADFTHDVNIMSNEKLIMLKKNVFNFFKELREYDLNNLDDRFIHDCLLTHSLDNRSIMNKYADKPKRQ